ncbi:hypothetical protein J6590_066126 [Homalodisca vitripennis]|nr:hypothetical protein J6590_066126 [Homalodisca vitripennis]
MNIAVDTRKGADMDSNVRTGMYSATQGSRVKGNLAEVAEVLRAFEPAIRDCSSVKGGRPSPPPCVRPYASLCPH